MTSRSAATLVLVTGGLLTTYALLDGRNAAVSSTVTYKRVYSSFLATVALGVAADLVPEIVGPFAILIIVAAWAKHKGVLGGIIQGSASAPSAAASGHAGGANSPRTSSNTIGGTQ
jgi:hypothetical protein